mgnify:FL=1
MTERLNFLDQCKEFVIENEREYRAGLLSRYVELSKQPVEKLTTNEKLEKFTILQELELEEDRLHFFLGEEDDDYKPFESQSGTL